MPRSTPPKTHLLPGEPPIPVLLRRSARARRFSLRVSRSDGQVSLSLPLWAPEAEALAFLRDRADWVRHHLAEAPGIRHARIGERIPVEGRDLPIVAGPGRAARHLGTALAAPPGPATGRAVAALLRHLARDRLADAVGLHAAALGRAPGRITLRDTRSRWGSCSQKGDLMFSWRLAMAPPEVLDYVAAHEVAHLAEMNHSPAFWSLCRRLCPETDRHRAWLRREGNALLAWRFDPPPATPETPEEAERC